MLLVPTVEGRWKCVVQRIAQRVFLAVKNYSIWLLSCNTMTKIGIVSKVKLSV